MFTVGRYQLQETLGEGGMGVVYKAFDPLLERTVAVKLISARLDDAPGLRQRFFAEARAAGQLSHKNIVTIFDLGEDNGHPYFAMEYLEGRNLRARLQSPERMSLDRKLEVMMQVCEGLAYAHSKGITHRDVKPANIFITDAGLVKVLDFGLARLPASELTHSKTLIGTLNYMAPEQIAGEKTDLRTDVFAVGVVFYELLSSRSPFQADSVASILHKILHELPQPVGSLDPGIPPELSAIVERAMAKAREERYQSLGELLIDLADCRGRIRASDPGSGAVTRNSALNTPSSSEMPGGGQGCAAGSSAGASGAAPGPSPGSSASARSSGSSASVPAVPAPCPAPPASSPASPSQSTASSAPPGSSHRFPVSGRSAPLAASAFVALTLTAAGAWLQWGPAGASEDRTRAADASLAAPGPPSDGPVDQPAARERPGRPSADPPPAAGAVTSSPEATAGTGRDEEPNSRPDAVRPPRAAPWADTKQGVRDQAPGRDDLAWGRAEAETARTAMTTARANAETSRSGELAPQAYAAALEAEAAARELLDRRRFGQATVKLYEASGLFRRADIEARAEQGRRAEAERLEDERRAEQAHRTEQARRAEQQARASREPAPPSPPDSPPAGASPPPGPETSGLGAASPAAGASEAAAAERAIREVLASYTAALEARRLDALERVWPGLSGAQKRAIREEFEGARSIAVTLLDPVIEAAGASATVTCQRHYVLDTKDGHHLEHRSPSVLTLRRLNGGGWVIESVRHGGGR